MLSNFPLFGEERLPVGHVAVLEVNNCFSCHPDRPKHERGGNYDPEANA